MATTEKRTQIYLAAAQHRAVLAVARRKGASLAAVVRDAIDVYLAREATSDEADWTGDPALALIGKLALPALPEGVSLNDAIDAAAYDEEEKSWSLPTARVSSRPSTARTRTTSRRRAPGGKSPRRGKGS